MSRSMDFLKEALLTDSEGRPAKIISLRGSGEGLDHLEITTQSKFEKEQGIATQHRVVTEEIDMDTAELCPLCVK